MEIEIVNTCSCGIVYTIEAWRQLKYIGPLEVVNGATLELRSCPPPCSSTRAIWVDADGNLVSDPLEEDDPVSTVAADILGVHRG